MTGSRSMSAAATAAGVEGQLFMWCGADCMRSVANVAKAKLKGFATCAEAEEAWETAQESAH